jgi:hypothetical protein
MAKLPIFTTNIRELSMMQTQWKSTLDTALGLPTNSPSLLTGISVVSGDNVINHKLGRTPQGWIITDINAGVTLYRSAAFNDLTLTLRSSGTATIGLMVF